MWLVLRLNGNNVEEITGVVPELSWDDPFTLEREIVKMPYNVFKGSWVSALVLKHPGLTTNIAYTQP